MRGRRVAAGATLAAAGLMSTYAAALRPAVSYASGLVKVAPRAAPIVPTCADADVTVTTAASLRTHAAAAADDSVICIGANINLSGAGYGLGRVMIPSDVTVAVVGISAQTTITGPTDDSYIFTSYDMVNPGDDTVTFANLTLEGGRAARGGAIMVEGYYLAGNRRSLVIDQVTFRDNEAADGAPTSFGGAVYGSRLRSVSITNSTFEDNSATNSGGAVFLNEVLGSVVIQDSTFADSHSTDGGGGSLHVRNASSVALQDDSFLNSDDTLGGGAVSLQRISASIHIVDSYWGGNSSHGLAGRDTTGSGGGLWIGGGTVPHIYVANSEFVGNSALSGYGGGAYIERVQDLEIVSSEFSGNSASNSLAESLGGGGGGLAVGLSGPSTISNSTFAGNQALYGGGLYVWDDSLSIENSTFANNQVTDPNSGFGGGAVFSWGTWLALDFTTIVGNSVVGTTPGSAIQVDNATSDDTLTITNSIVAGNVGVSGSEIATGSGIPLVIDYSAITDDTSVQPVGGPTSILNVIYGADSPLLLGPLQDNGGPTRTIAPGAGSSAIDAGNPAWSAPPSTDQRGTGFPRLIGARVDIGAVEGTGAPNPTPTPTPTPVFPAGVPRDVAATAGDRSATVAWQVPTTTGSFPVSAYQVTSTPGGQSCLTTALSCTVTGLGNGTSYTFRVKALNGAGWGASSEPSNAVTPWAEPKPAIMIAGTRSGRTIAITGEATGLPSGSVVTPWTRVGLGRDFVPGRDVDVSDDGTFMWSRRASTKNVVHVYVTSDDVRSNTVRLQATAAP
jgi:hypothetical protein